ncbi:hypothetical protein Tco_0121151 [Tanacetum coccineum]
MTTSKLPSLIGIRSILKVPGPDDLTLLQYKRPEGFLASYSVDGVTSVTVVILRYILDSLGTGSLPSGRNPTDEDGDIGMGDLTGVSVSLGGGISSGGKKSQESNIGDSDNTVNRGKTTGVE